MIGCRLHDVPGVAHGRPWRDKDVVDPAIEQDTVWLNEFFIPYSLFEHYLGKFGDKTGMTWRANFYKCGDKTPMPHWASWAPITATNFHLPDCFQPLKFV